MATSPEELCPQYDYKTSEAVVAMEICVAQ